MQTQSDRFNEDVLRLNDECKLRARALIVSVRCINVDINIARGVTSIPSFLLFFLFFLEYSLLS